MEAEKIPPHLSAEEHALRLTEEQLLKEGRQWLSRAANLYTQTPKIKIWVPVLSSVLLTGYYLYNMHAAAAQKTPLPAAPAAAPVAVEVAEDTAAPKPTMAVSTVVVGIPPGAAADAEDSDADLLKKAQQAHSDQQYGSEGSLLQKVLTRSKSPQNVCPAVGKAYERAGEIDLSIRAFEQCVAVAPGDVDTLLAFGHALQAKPDFKRAAAVYRECLQKDAGNVDAQSGLALIELRQNHLARADQAARAILQKAPENTDALLITGLAAWRQGKLSDAQKTFLRGVELDDRREDFHAFLGRIAEAQGRPQDALQQYERALALDPNDSDIADRRNRLKDVK